jgi:hypothetical protein
MLKRTFAISLWVLNIFLKKREIIYFNGPVWIGVLKAKKLAPPFSPQIGP